MRSPRRRRFWPLVLRALRRVADTLSRALELAVIGESLVEYTQSLVSGS